MRASIFESGDDTSANVVQLTEAPTHLSVHGQSHREIGDTSPPIPEIGDEVAVARALRHLADQLLGTAAGDIEAVTGKEAHFLPSEGKPIPQGPEARCLRKVSVFFAAYRRSLARPNPKGAP